MTTKTTPKKARPLSHRMILALQEMLFEGGIIEKYRTHANTAAALCDRKLVYRAVFNRCPVYYLTPAGFDAAEASLDSAVLATLPTRGEQFEQAHADALAANAEMAFCPAPECDWKRYPNQLRYGTGISGQQALHMHIAVCHLPMSRSALGYQGVADGNANHDATHAAVLAWLAGPPPAARDTRLLPNEAWTAARSEYIERGGSIIGCVMTEVPQGDDGKDVHTEHCCKRHGCKYGTASVACPVISGAKPQSYPCEKCDDDPDPDVIAETERLAVLASAKVAHCTRGEDIPSPAYLVGAITALVVRRHRPRQGLSEGEVRTILAQVAGIVLAADGPHHNDGHHDKEHHA
jgi:hypothetical protein